MYKLSIFSVYPALAAVGYAAILAMKIADDKRKEEERRLEKLEARQRVYGNG